MTVKHTVEAALLALSSVDQDRASIKNGVGFNGRDTGFGNSLARQVTAGKDLSPKQYGTAYRMLKTYKVQLKDFGIDYDQIAPPDGNAPKEIPRYVDFSGGLFYVYFPYDVVARENLKANVPGRAWDGDAKAWTVPPESGSQLGKWALDFRVSVREAALDQMSKKVKKPEPKFNDTWKASWAVDADIEVPLPEGLELYGFQKADIKYALDNIKPGQGILFGDEMGLGKTPQSALVLQLKKAYPAIIAMPRVVWLKWAKELQTWTPGLRITMLGGRIISPKTRLVAKRFGAEVVKLGDPIPESDVYLVKYSVLEKWVKPLGRKVGKSKYKKNYHVQGPLKELNIKGIVLDECHYLKDESAKRTKAALALCHTLKPDVRLSLSGTPIPNRHLELLTTLLMLNRLKDVAKNDYDYMQLFCNKNGYGVQGDFGYMEFDGSPNGDLLNQLLRSKGIMAQHEKKDHKIQGIRIPGVQDQLPAIVPNYIPADLKNPARYEAVHANLIVKRREYAEALKRLKQGVAGKYPKEQQNKLRGVAKGLQNQLGVLTNEARKVCGEEKIAFDIEWIQGWLDGSTSEQKLIVFGYHRLVNEALRDNFGCPLIYGGQDEGVRQEAEDAFQENPSVRLIVCQIEAASIGINLTAATDIAFVELPYVPKDLTQAIGRAYGRLNDAHGVEVTYLMYFSPDPDDPSIEEKIAKDVLDPKREVHNKAVSGA